MRILLFLIILLIIETIATALIKKIRLKHRAQLLILAKENALLSSEFVLPDWAKDEEGNRLFAKACAIGAIPGSLLFKSAALEYIETKVANQGWTLLFCSPIYFVCRFTHCIQAHKFSVLYLLIKLK